jgi:hypothetical protein
VLTPGPRGDDGGRALFEKSLARVIGIAASVCNQTLALEDGDQSVSLSAVMRCQPVRVNLSGLPGASTLTRFLVLIPLDCVQGLARLAHRCAPLRASHSTPSTKQRRFASLPVRITLHFRRNASTLFRCSSGSLAISCPRYALMSAVLKNFERLLWLESARSKARRYD